MKILYNNNKTEKKCTDLKVAKKQLGHKIAIKLFQTINFIENASSLKDIVLYIPFHFHNLSGDRNGMFAIDIGGRKSGYRLLLEPLDENDRRYDKPDIDKISSTTYTISIEEVGNHYE